MNQPHSHLTAIAIFLLSTFTALADEVAAPIDVKVAKKKKQTLYKTNLLAHLKSFAPKAIRLSKYGGRMDRREQATGFFRTQKTATGWILVDPDGYHFRSVGVNAVAPNEDNPDHKEAFRRTFSDVQNWARKTQAFLIDDLRFNSLGCWSDWSAFKAVGREVPYTRRWNLIATYAKKKGITHKQYGHTGFSNDVLPVFDKGFAAFCSEKCKELLKTRNDPWLIGHFTDNELPFKQDGILKRYLKSPTNDASYQAARNWLNEKGISKDQIRSKHDIEFAGLVIGTYYRTVHDAIRKYDPNHLILGTRFHGRASSQEICYKACGPYVDVVSINYYNRWTPEQEALNRRAELAGKPILITEWYAKGADSNCRNTAGAGFTVLTQKDRGRFYENYTIGLLRNRNIVGWHWFRYIDDGDLKTKGMSSNKGILDIHFTPYSDLAGSMRAINAVHYQLADYLRGLKSGNLLDEPTRK